MSKYAPLVSHLQNAPTAHVRLEFATIEKILGAPLPSSASNYQAWWANSSTDDSHTWAHAWQNAGWKVHRLDLAGKEVVFRRIRTRGGAAQTNPEKELAALATLGGSGTLEEIHAQLLRTHGSFDYENLRKDLVMLSVNDERRFAYRAWKTRRGIAMSDLDRVFVGPGEGKKRRYELYEPAVHGVWEVYQKSTGGPGLRPVVPITAEAAVEAAASGIEYDPSSDAGAKEFAVRAIATRRGAPKFRKALLAAYGGRCCITGCAVEGVLEAAHIRPYAGDGTNAVSNGLLLRADVHTLLDLGLLAIEPKTLTVSLHPKLREDAAYQHLHGKQIAMGGGPPSSKALTFRWEWQVTWAD